MATNLTRIGFRSAMRASPARLQSRADRHANRLTAFNRSTRASQHPLPPANTAASLQRNVQRMAANAPLPDVISNSLVNPGHVPANPSGLYILASAGDGQKNGGSFRHRNSPALTPQTPGPSADLPESNALSPGDSSPAPAPIRYGQLKRRIEQAALSKNASETLRQSLRSPAWPITVDASLFHETLQSLDLWLSACSVEEESFLSCPDQTQEPELLNTLLFLTWNYRSDPEAFSKIIQEAAELHAAGGDRYSGSAASLLILYHLRREPMDLDVRFAEETLKRLLADSEVEWVKPAFQTREDDFHPAYEVKWRSEESPVRLTCHLTHDRPRALVGTRLKGLLDKTALLSQAASRSDSVKMREILYSGIFFESRRAMQRRVSVYRDSAFEWALSTASDKDVLLVPFLAAGPQWEQSVLISAQTRPSGSAQENSAVSPSLYLQDKPSNLSALLERVLQQLHAVFDPQGHVSDDNRQYLHWLHDRLETNDHLKLTQTDKDGLAAIIRHAAAGRLPIEAVIDLFSVILAVDFASRIPGCKITILESRDLATGPVRRRKRGETESEAFLRQSLQTASRNSPASLAGLVVEMHFNSDNDPMQSIFPLDEMFKALQSSIASRASLIQRDGDNWSIRIPTPSLIGAMAGIFFEKGAIHWTPVAGEYPMDGINRLHQERSNPLGLVLEPAELFDVAEYLASKGSGRLPLVEPFQYLWHDITHGFAVARVPTVRIDQSAFMFDVLEGLPASFRELPFFSPMQLLLIELFLPDRALEWRPEQAFQPVSREIQRAINGQDRPYLESIYSFLETYYDALLQTEGHSTAPDAVFSRIDELKRKIEKASAMRTGISPSRVPMPRQITVPPGAIMPALQDLMREIDLTLQANGDMQRTPRLSKLFALAQSDPNFSRIRNRDDYLAALKSLQDHRLRLTLEQQTLIAAHQHDLYFIGSLLLSARTNGNGDALFTHLSRATALQKELGPKYLGTDLITRAALGHRIGPSDSRPLPERHALAMARRLASSEGVTRIEPLFGGNQAENESTLQIQRDGEWVLAKTGIFLPQRDGHASFMGTLSALQAEFDAHYDKGMSPASRMPQGNLALIGVYFKDDRPDFKALADTYARMARNWFYSEAASANGISAFREIQINFYYAGPETGGRYREFGALSAHDTDSYEVTDANGQKAPLAIPKQEDALPSNDPRFERFAERIGRQLVANGSVTHVYRNGPRIFPWTSSAAITHQLGLTGDARKFRYETAKGIYGDMKQAKASLSEEDYEGSKFTAKYRTLEGDLDLSYSTISQEAQSANHPSYRSSSKIRTVRDWHRFIGKVFLAKAIPLFEANSIALDFTATALDRYGSMALGEMDSKRSIDLGQGGKARVYGDPGQMILETYNLLLIQEALEQAGVTNIRIARITAIHADHVVTDAPGTQTVKSGYGRGGAERLVNSLAEDRRLSGPVLGMVRNILKAYQANAQDSMHDTSCLAFEENASGDLSVVIRGFPS